MIEKNRQILSTIAVQLSLAEEEVEKAKDQRQKILEATRKHQIKSTSPSGNLSQPQIIKYRQDLFRLLQVLADVHQRIDLAVSLSQDLENG